MQALLKAGFMMSSLADIAVSGLPGWATIAAGDRASVQVSVSVCRGVEAYIRHPLPCPTPVEDSHM